MQAPGLRVWVPRHKALGQQAWVEPEDNVTSTPWGRRLWDDTPSRQCSGCWNLPGSHWVSLELQHMCCCGLTESQDEGRDQSGQEPGQDGPRLRLQRL